MPASSSCSISHCRRVWCSSLILCGALICTKVVVRIWCGRGVESQSNFVRTAIRRQLESRADAVNDTVARRALMPGTSHLSRRDLEELLNAGQTVKLHVLGLATFVFRSEVLGAFRRSRQPSRPARPPSRHTAPAERSTSTSQRTPKGSHGRPPRRRYVASIEAHPRRTAEGGVGGPAPHARGRTSGRISRHQPGNPRPGPRRPPHRARAMAHYAGRWRPARQAAGHADQEAPRRPAPAIDQSARATCSPPAAAQDRPARLRRPPRPAVRSATCTTPTRPGPEATTSISRPATPVRRCPWSSCCTAASRTPPTSPPAPG